MLLIREHEVLELLPMREAIRLVRAAFLALAEGQAQNQVRRRLMLPTGAILHAMGGAWGKYFGTKIYSTHVKHGAYFLVALYDSETAQPLALLEAAHLGQIRTGATTAVAADLLALPEARTLGLIGSGFQARGQLAALREVRALDEVRVWSRKEENRRAFAEECSQKYQLPVRAVDSAEEAVRGADLVVTATYSREPVLDAGWVQPGAHVTAIGSNYPTRRELPTELILRADLVVVDSYEQARLEAGDLLLALNPEDWTRLPLAELAAVVAGRRGREQPHHITIFKSHGLGLEDVAVAGYVYEQALAQGAGERLPLFEPQS